MKANNESQSRTLGEYLERGRQSAGLSLRQLAQASGVHVSAVNRLLKDEVEHPSAEQLQRITEALELDVRDAFGFIGVTPPKGLPSVTPYLRAKYHLQGEALDEAAEEIQRIIDKYNNAPPD